MKKIALGLVIAAAVVFAFAATPPAAKAGDTCKGGTCPMDSKVAAKTGGDCKGGTCPMEAKASAKAGKDCGNCAMGGHAAKVEAKMDGACAMGGDCDMKGAKNAKAGCCNAPGKLAKFKVFADGKWMFYGCKEMAAKGRQELLTMAFKVGQVLPVTGKVQIPANQSLI